MTLFSFQSEVIGPVVLGMVIRHFSTKIALWMEKAASILGTLFLLAALVTGVVSNSHLFTDHWKLWIASALLMPVGSTLGYVNARLARLPSKACRTICLETGLQNSTLALTILAFSFGTPRNFELYRFSHSCIACSSWLMGSLSPYSSGFCHGTIRKAARRRSQRSRRRTRMRKRASLKEKA